LVFNWRSFFSLSFLLNGFSGTSGFFSFLITVLGFTGDSSAFFSTLFGGSYFRFSLAGTGGVEGGCALRGRSETGGDTFSGCFCSCTVSASGCLCSWDCWDLVFFFFSSLGGLV